MTLTPLSPLQRHRRWTMTIILLDEDFYGSHMDSLLLALDGSKGDRVGLVSEIRVHSVSMW